MMVMPNVKRYTPYKDTDQRPLCNVCPVWHRKYAIFFDNYRTEPLCAVHMAGRISL